MVVLAAGQRVIVVSHGGALHAIHHAARGYQAKGKVMNCALSVLLAEPDAAAPAAAGQGQQAQQQQTAGGSQCLQDTSQLRSAGSGVWCDPAEPCQHCSSTADGDTPPHAGPDADAAAVGGTGGAAAAAGSSAAAAPVHTHAHGMQRCGGSRVRGGRLALLEWNDGSALAAEHVASGSGFGGGSKAG
jgi:hypothetical protein